MSARSAFLLASGVLHLVLAWWLLLPGSAFNDAGIVDAKTMTARLLASDTIITPKREVITARPSVESADAATQAATEAATDFTTVAAAFATAAPSMAAPAEIHWVSAGSLTRAPAPLEEIDLAVAQPRPGDFTGRLNLTLLIDRHGRVVDVLSELPGDARSDDPSGESNGKSSGESIHSGNPSTLTFLHHVEQKFRQARFTPGEVHGVAVDTRLNIRIVSEPAQSAPL